MRRLNYLLLGSLLGLSSLSFASTFQGELEVLVADDFENSKSTITYYLHEGDELYSLKIPKAIDKANLLTGVKVIIDGEEVTNLQEKTIKVNSLTIDKNSLQKQSAKEGLYDMRRILTLLVNFNNIKTTSTVSPANVDSMLYTGAQSMARNYKHNSFSQLFFERDTNKDGAPDIYIVNLTYDAGACDFYKWAADAKSAASRAGINLAAYRHHMLVLPYNINCGWGGLGDLGCGTSCTTWIRGYSPASIYSQLIYTHEIGHNLGMHHAATDTNNDGTVDSEYGDAACVMGTGDFKYYKEANAPHRDQMGWFNAFPNRIATVTAGTYTLFPVEAGVSNTGLLALRVKRNATETYYISYRKNIGPFGAGAPNYLDRINIHKTRTGDNHTYFIRTISAGETFVDMANNVKITAIVTGGSTALVKVN